MAQELAGRSVAVLATDGVEEQELATPMKALTDAGATTQLLSLNTGEIQSWRHHDKASTFGVDLDVHDASPYDFDALVLPGGVANPDRLRTDEAAVAFAKTFFDAGKPVGAICHAPWLLAEADVVRERHLTSWPSLRTDLQNAGAQWSDEEVVVCSGGPNVLVSSRKPDDLPAFCAAIIDQFAKAAAPTGRGRST